MPLTAGIHLPQAGPAASGEALRRAAVLAEQLGYADVWVSDHLVVPTGVPYPPSAYVFEPITCLAWVAAATERVRLGTTVLVMPMRNPLMVAKAFATIDQFSGGRAILGTAAGWLEAEFDALGVPFDERGPRTDEAIDMIQTMWTSDHITADYPVHGASFASIRAKPQPVDTIPIWIGGHAPVALRRAARVGSGWHGGFLTAEQTAKRINQLRDMDLPEGFEMSMRTRWDPLVHDHDTILGELQDLANVGVTHVVPEPQQRTLDDYLRSIEHMAELLVAGGVEMAAA